MRARLSTDGGARGNPGPAAFAYVLETDDGMVLDARGEAIGVATNNVAEYRAVRREHNTLADSLVNEALDAISG